MPNSAADQPQPLTRLQPFAIPDGFLPATAPVEGAADTSLPAWWFVCAGSRLLTSAAPGEVDGLEHTDTLIQAHQLEDWGIVPVRTQFLGYLHNRPCIAAELPQSVALPEALTLCHLRELYGRLSEDLFAIAARAVQTDRMGSYPPILRPLRHPHHTATD